MSELLKAIRVTAAEYRQRHQLDQGWYIMLPTWVVYRNGDYEAFCAEFVASMKRLAGLPFGHIRGFETIDPEGNDVRFTLPWAKAKET